MRHSVWSWIQPYVYWFCGLALATALLFGAEPHLSMDNLLLAVSALSGLGLVLVLVLGHQYGQQIRPHARLSTCLPALGFGAVVWTTLQCLPLSSQYAWTHLFVFGCGLVWGYVHRPPNSTET